MASPQLGGATSFFSDASRPGVHMKGWKAAGIVDRRNQSDESLGLPPDLRLKSLSTNDLSYFAASSPSTAPSPTSHPHTPSSSFSSHRHRRGGDGGARRAGRGKGIHSRISNLTASTSAVASSDMNTLPEIPPSPEGGGGGGEGVSRDRASRGGGRAKEAGEKEGQKNDEGNSSFLKQVGNLFSWSGLGGSRGARNQQQGDDRRAPSDDSDAVDTPGGGSDMGLAGIL